MIVRRVTEPLIAQCGYLIACARTRQAILVDPVRDTKRYQLVAHEIGVSIMAVLETHAPSDYISGVREVLLASACRAYLSGETTPPVWFASNPSDWAPRVTFLRDGDTLTVGDLTIRAVLTPGHAAGGLSFFIEDQSSGVRVIATGDALLVGGAGRVEGGETECLRDSLSRLGSLPDDTVVLAGHTSGSSCGIVVALPGESTLGLERRFNRALRAVNDPAAFALATEGKQPDRPSYFSRVERINQTQRPTLIHQLLKPNELHGDIFVQLVSMPHTVVIDTRPWHRFALDGLEGALHVPLDRYFAPLVASGVAPDERLVIVCDRGDLDAIVDGLRLVGLDRIEGWIESTAYTHIDDSLLDLAEIEELTQAEAHAMNERGEVRFLDVRTTAEWLRGRIRGAQLMTLSQLPELADRLPRDQLTIAYCRTGARSARACSYLQRRGHRCATLQGGYWPWFGRGFPVDGADQPF
ncbi:MAG: MBL fold metallo-hydrolase [Phycisphaerales bacterium]|nr:MBL fold metallo-hydrolase [Phycisphaerales bacterium]